MNSYLNAAIQLSIKTFAVLASFLQLAGLKVVDANSGYRLLTKNIGLFRTKLNDKSQKPVSYHKSVQYISSAKMTI